MCNCLFSVNESYVMGKYMEVKEKMKKYNYTGNANFEDAYNDCKLVTESIVDEKKFSKCKYRFNTLLHGSNT